MRRPNDFFPTLAIFLVATALLLPSAFFGLPSSKAVVGGLRVLAGEVPYRDFWTMYAPGQFYAVALLFRAFGRELLAPAVAAVLLHAAAAALGFLVLRRAGLARALAALAALALCVAGWEISPELDSYPPVLAAALFALVCAARWAAAGDKRWLWAAGLAVGVAATFKHDVAAYLCIAIGGGLWLAGPLRRADGSPARLGLREVAAAELSVAAGALLIVVPVVVLLAQAAGRDAWIDLIVFPATDFRAVRSEPYPSLWPAIDARAWLGALGDLRAARDVVRQGSLWVLGHLPELAFFYGVGLFALRRRQLERPARFLLGTALAGLPLFWWAAHTQPNTHLVTMAVLSAVVAAVGFARVPSPRRPERIALSTAALLYTVALTAEPIEGAARVLRHGTQREALARPGARGIRISPREAAYFGPIADFVQANTAPDEPIYVGIGRHDLPVVGNLRIYVLSRRLPCVRYHEVHPAITDDAEKQREMIADIEEHGVRCIVLWNFGGDDPDWAPAGLEARRDERRARNPQWGSELLDRWIDAHFERVGTVDEYELLWRRDVPPPRVPFGA